MRKQHAEDILCEDFILKSDMTYQDRLNVMLFMMYCVKIGYSRWMVKMLANCLFGLILVCATFEHTPNSMSFTCEECFCNIFIQDLMYKVFQFMLIPKGHCFMQSCSLLSKKVHLHQH